MACHFYKNQSQKMFLSHRMFITMPAWLQPSLTRQLLSLSFLSSAWAHSPPGGLPLCFSSIKVALLLSWGALPAEDVPEFGLLKLVVVQALYLISFTTFSAGKDPRWTLWFLVLLSLCCVWNSHSVVLLLWHVCMTCEALTCMPCLLHCFCLQQWTPQCCEAFIMTHSQRVPSCFKETKGCLYCITLGGAKTVCFSNASH